MSKKEDPAQEISPCPKGSSSRCLAWVGRSAGQPVCLLQRRVGCGCPSFAPTLRTQLNYCPLNYHQVLSPQAVTRPGSGLPQREGKGRGGTRVCSGRSAAVWVQFSHSCQAPRRPRGRRLGKEPGGGGWSLPDHRGSAAECPQPQLAWPVPTLGRGRLLRGQSPPQEEAGGRECPSQRLEVPQEALPLPGPPEKDF